MSFLLHELWLGLDRPAWKAEPSAVSEIDDEPEVARRLERDDEEFDQDLDG